MTAPGIICEDCGSELQWVKCGECVNGYDAREPIRPCRFCGGFGGYWNCPAYEDEVAAANAEANREARQ